MKKIQRDKPVFTAYLMQIDEETESQWYENGRDGYYAENILFWTELPESPLKK